MGSAKYDERAFGPPEHQHAQRRLLQVFDRLGLDDAIVAACGALHRQGGHNVYDAIAQALIELARSRKALMDEWARTALRTVTPVFVGDEIVHESATHGAAHHAPPRAVEVPSAEKLAYLLSEAFGYSPEFTAAEVEIVRQGLEAARDDQVAREAELAVMMTCLAPPVRR